MITGRLSEPFRRDPQDTGQPALQTVTVEVDIVCPQALNALKELLSGAQAIVMRVNREEPPF